MMILDCRLRILDRRHLPGGGAFWTTSVLFMLVSAGLANGQTAQLTYLGVQTVPTGTTVGGVEFGGVSGIFYDPHADRFRAITDDSRAAGRSRIWNVRLDYTAAAFTSAVVESGYALRTAAGGTFPVADTEGIAGNLDGSLYVSHEGLAAGTDPVNNIPPWIRRFDSVSENQLAEITLPEKFLPRDSNGQLVNPDSTSQVTGVRSNLGLECLGISPSRRTLYTANEAALKQDDSRTFNSDTTQAQNSDIRIVRFNGVPGNPAAAEEKVYRADLGTLYIIVRRFNTVPEILPIGDTGRMLVLERGLTQNNTNLGSYRIRIYEVDFDQTGTTNVAGNSSLIGASVTRLSKTLLWESSSNMDNVEAMCWGRDINGFRTLVLASDNNFATAQTTQFHVLLTNIPAVPRRTISTATIGNGTVTAQPNLAWYPDGAEVSLTAAPATHFTFKRWEGDALDSSNPLVVIMDADRSVTARFFSPFQQWKTGFFSDEEIFNSQMSWPEEDPDGDGIPNLLEYALGTNPRLPSREGLPELESTPSELALTYWKNPALADLAWQVEVSSDLVQWSALSDSLVSTQNGLELRRASVPTNPPRTFLRLKVIKLF